MICRDMIWYDIGAGVGRIPCARARDGYAEHADLPAAGAAGVVAKQHGASVESAACAAHHEHQGARACKPRHPSDRGWLHRVRTCRW